MYAAFSHGDSGLLVPARSAAYHCRPVEILASGGPSSCYSRHIPQAQEPSFLYYFPRLRLRVRIPQQRKSKRKPLNNQSTRTLSPRRRGPNHNQIRTCVSTTTRSAHFAAARYVIEISLAKDPNLQLSEKTVHFHAVRLRFRERKRLEQYILNRSG